MGNFWMLAGFIAFGVIVSFVYRMSRSRGTGTSESVSQDLNEAEYLTHLKRWW